MIIGLEVILRLILPSFITIVSCASSATEAQANTLREESESYAPLSLVTRSRFSSVHLLRLNAESGAFLPSA
jgi:hypothetical protein